MSLATRPLPKRVLGECALCNPTRTLVLAFRTLVAASVKNGSHFWKQQKSRWLVGGAEGGRVYTKHKGIGSGGACTVKKQQ